MLNTSELFYFIYLDICSHLLHVWYHATIMVAIMVVGFSIVIIDYGYWLLSSIMAFVQRLLMWNDTLLWVSFIVIYTYLVKLNCK